MRKYETGIEPGKCGIYGIEYKELGIVYVGQSKNIHSRLKDHRVQSIKIKKSKEEKKGIGGFIVEM